MVIFNWPFALTLAFSGVSQSAALGNRLMPFSSDGCSSFPDGIPLIYENLWRHCCISHDVAYWAGGTANERKTADLALRDCVDSATNPVLAEAMLAGIRIGGHPALPFSWRWGYGWVLPRGFRELNEAEREQMQLEIAKIPADLRQIVVQATPSVATRPSLTGDYCVDEAIGKIELGLQRSFHLVSIEGSIEERPGGWWKTLKLKPEGCDGDFQFTFLLLHPDACETPINELLARGRVRLMGRAEPPRCS